MTRPVSSITYGIEASPLALRLAPNLADHYIPTSNRVKARLSGYVGTVVDVHIPAATWDR